MAINFASFDVLKGHSPCGVERIQQRKKAIDDGQWVRDAAVAYAEKQKANAA